jgi:hypothetical protein
VNDSTTAGLLVQTFPPHVADKLDQTFVLGQSTLTLANSLDDDDLFDFFHVLIVGLTALPGDVVLPRWQPEPPNIPSAAPNWCGFGIDSYEADLFPAEVMRADGTFEMHLHEKFSVLFSFYGANAGAYARMIRDGIKLSQNYEVLQMNNMGIVEGGEVRMIPSLLKERWLRRADVAFTFKRQVVRGFPVVPMTGVSVSIDNGAYTENVDFNSAQVLRPIEVVNFVPRVRADLLGLTLVLDSSVIQ